MKRFFKPKTYTLLTFGCQMNYSDSERFASILEKVGISPVKDYQNADLVIINTCSVKQKAEDRIVGLGKKFNEIKSQNPNKIFVLSGCMARRSWQEQVLVNNMDESKRQEKLFIDMPWLDILIETRNFPQLINILNNRPIDNNPPIEEYLSYTPNTENNIHGFIPISVGCNHFCTYCIVPFARGKEICREYKPIEDEFKALSDKGCKDITLLGQTVNRWINPKFKDTYILKTTASTRIENLNTQPLKTITDDPKDILQMLQKLDQFEGEYWISFMSSHPNYMTKELIDFAASSKHIRPYFHFALQSGSNKMLAKMNRGHTIEEFTEIAKYFKAKIPDSTLSTDIIVGFPGETEADFQQTITAMKDLNFDLAFISEFSPRKGTAAARIKDDIPNKVKAARRAYLNDVILAKEALMNNKKLIGKTKKVLIEKITAKFFIGRLDNNKEIRIPNTDTNSCQINTFQNVEITNCTSWALEGNLI
jgi:tRNA-2-methylthio-N6-dimethylallyladenosine synthase